MLQDQQQQDQAKTSGKIAVREKFRVCVSCKKNRAIRKFPKTTLPPLRRGRHFLTSSTSRRICRGVLGPFNF